MEFDNEFELEEGRTPKPPDDEDDIEEEDETEEEEEGFVELPEAEYQALSLSDQRRCRSRLEQFKKDLKRENARSRKKAQRDRAKSGVPAGTENKLRTEWQKQRQDVQSNPERVTEFAELKERLANFNVVESQTQAAITRMRDGVHPEEPQPGSYYEMIAADYIALAKRYGIGPAYHLQLIPVFIDAMHHTKRGEALQKLRDDPGMHYRMVFGLEIDHVFDCDFYHFFSVFFDWFLNHRDDPSYDYDWVDSDAIVQEFEIPEKFLNESPGSGIRYVWVRLDNYRRKATNTPYRAKTTSEILAEDADVQRKLKDLGY